MISVSDIAQKELDAFFSGSPETNRSVRVYLASGG